MTNGKIAAIFCEIGAVLCMVSMVLGPFDIVNESIAAGVLASAIALVGMYFAFRSWNEPQAELFAEQENLPCSQEVQAIVCEEIKEEEN